ncbi:MAG: heat-inducible transcription repressor HrcA, partial [Desulfohalobiaceae bacterium]
MSLNSREIDVVNIIVQAYIQHAVPVGSRYVAKQSGLGLSPASMRNVMADLTDKGYLTQPYTSAGRIPTQKAFRFYVDSMLKPG